MDLEGTVNLSYGEQKVSLQSIPIQKTLDEPIKDTLMRDLHMIAYKLKYVLKPQMREESAKELRDLWGPLVLCLFLALVLSFNSTSQSESVFAMVFLIIWVGVLFQLKAFVVTLNAKLLKANISVFWSVSVLGYSSLILCIKMPFFVKAIVVIPAFVWSSISSIAFMSSQVGESRKILAVYPVVLFYLCLSWFLLLIQ